MVKVVKYFVLIFVMSLLFFKVNAQNVKEDFKKINNVYKGYSSLLLEQEMRYYRNYNTDSCAGVEKSVIKKKNNMIYSRSFNIENILNNKYAMEIDKDSKVIAITKSKESIVKNLFLIGLDSIANFCDTTYYYDIGSNKAKYRLSFSELISSEYRFVDITYNKENYEIEKMDLYFLNPFNRYDGSEPEKPRVEIIYTKMVKNAEINDDIFSEKTYLNMVNGEFVANKKYQGYEVIDLTKDETKN